MLCQEAEKKDRIEVDYPVSFVYDKRISDIQGGTKELFISTKGRYALRVMIELAKNETDRFIPLQDIAEKLQISKEYLNSILKLLVREGQLSSLRGTGGGYKLCFRPEEYKIGTILRIVEGNLAPVSCVEGSGKCPSSCHCSSHAMWNDLNNVIGGFLDGITLTDFLEGGRYYSDKDV